MGAAPVRLGIGFCFYKLGNIDMAKKAFHRVEQLDPLCSVALGALGLLGLETGKPADIKRGAEFVRRAFELNPYCLNSVNYMANDLFMNGRCVLAKKLSKTALAVPSTGSTRSYSYFNLARCYHIKGRFEKAQSCYVASVAETDRPDYFVLPYYGLGQLQLRHGVLKSALASFQKVLAIHPNNSETLKVIGHVYVQLGQSANAREYLSRAVKAYPCDPEAFLHLAELLVSSDVPAALDALKAARDLFRQRNGKVSVELLNNIGVLHMERGELDLAKPAFMDALGEGLWLKFLDANPRVEANEGGEIDTFRQYPIDFSLFDRLEEDGTTVELPYDKVSPLFNLALLLEQLHDYETASIFYRFILYKYASNVDAYLRLAAIAKSRNNVQLSKELILEALKVDAGCGNALLMLGDLELKKGDWIKAKKAFRSAKDCANGNDAYATLCLGNWNYDAAIRAGKRDPKLEATHLEKAMELYTEV